MDKIKRLLLIAIPTSICNFRCHYCYLSQREECYKGEQAKMRFSPEAVAYALRPERLGGLAFMNFCADGETLLTKDIDKYIYELVKQGHYAEIVTNATITPVIDKILSWDKEFLKRVEFKCSFHYIELKNKNLLDVFAENVKKIWEKGASCNIEITPSDELVPMIDEVKEFSIKHFGALPHLTIARNDNTSNIDYLTNMSMEEYNRVWSQFKSEFWEFKKTIFKKPVRGFCYAGDWSLLIDLSSGSAHQCYLSNFSQNVFECPDEPINFKAIGKCKTPHCYNGHALLTMGCVPNATNVKYGDIRNRKKQNGEMWLTSSVLDFFNTTLNESNKEYTASQKLKIRTESMMSSASVFLRKVDRRIKKR